MKHFVFIGLISIACSTSADGFNPRYHPGPWRPPYHHHDFHGPIVQKHPHGGYYGGNDFDSLARHDADGDDDYYTSSNESGSDESWENDKSGENGNLEEKFEDWRRKSLCSPNTKYPPGTRLNLNPFQKTWKTKRTYPPGKIPETKRPMITLPSVKQKRPTTVSPIPKLTNQISTSTTKPTHLNTTSQPILTTRYHNTSTDSATTQRIPKQVPSDSFQLSSSPLLTCIRSCPTSTEYSPLCGTDGVTYKNMAEIQCVQGCGIKIDIHSSSACPPRTVTQNGISSTTQTPTTVPDLGRTVTLSVYQRCMKQCDFTANYEPVCGTDHVTYVNIERLECANQCGNAVSMLCNSTCPACSETFSSGPSASAPNAAPSQLPIYPPEIRNCFITCSNQMTENIPICGSDGVTYRNLGHLLCAQECGLDISIQSTSACEPRTVTQNVVTNTQRPPTTVPDLDRTVTLSGYQKCMKQCDFTGNYDPVCGTDLVTYINIERLECAKQCGNAINVLCNSTCPACPESFALATSVSPPTTAPSRRPIYSKEIRDCLKTCPPMTEYNPVCGSDGVTYSNPGHLLCAQLCGIDVKVTRLFACDSPTTTTGRPTTTVSDCLRNCPVTSEYNPICGSDGVTYMNPSRIECANLCGVRVAAVKNTPCNVSSGDTSTTSSAITNSPLRPTSTSTAIPGTTIPSDVLISVFDTPPPDYTILETDIRFGENDPTDKNKAGNSSGIDFPE